MRNSQTVFLLISYAILLCLQSLGVIGIFSDIGRVTVSKEKQLIRQLLREYESQGINGRPVYDHLDSILVNFSLSLIQIMDVDEKNQILKTNVWYHYEWMDRLLRWNPLDHDNITSIRVPSDKVWLPDIMLYNFADDRLKEKRDALVVIQHTGEVLWMPQAMLNSSCSFDTLFFPFDEQMCTLKFGSWTYNGLKLDLDFIDGQNAMDTSDFTPSNEWTIVGNAGIKTIKYYACCPEPYPDITFTLRIRRRVAFYTFILLLPCALLSLLTLVIFWVPPESPAKLQIGMNIFLAFFLLLLLLADFTPRAAATIPLIGAYFCLSMILITMSTVLACIVSNMFFRGVRMNRAPRWLRSCVIDGLARGLLLRDSFLEKPQDVTTPRKTWSTFVSTYRSFSDPETLRAKVHLLDAEDNGGGRSKTVQHAGSVVGDFPDGGDEDDEDSDNVNQDDPHPASSAALKGGLSSYSCRSLADDWLDAYPGTTRRGRVRELDSDDLGEEREEEEDEARMLEVLSEDAGSIREMMADWQEDREKSDGKERFVKEWRMIAMALDRLFFILYIGINIVGLLAIFFRVNFPD